jgi:hypothetical protein
MCWLLPAMQVQERQRQLEQDAAEEAKVAAHNSPLQQS